MNKHVTKSTTETKKLGQSIAERLYGGEVICLSGDLGAGKTTFSQGLLKGLGIKGPYTSPTFAILKVYHLSKNKSSNSITEVNHIDAYRIGSKDLIDLGFKDFAGRKNSITIIEWPEKVKRIIPTNAVWIDFKWLNDKERQIILNKK